ncbi:MAG: alpha/beta fold hydrolase [bacterium]|nr:alpha/beta fold hydrolase [bacterium]
MLGYLAFSLFAAHTLTKPLSRYLDKSPKLISEKYEDINFTTEDGLKLTGWLLKPQNQSEKLIIFVSGLRGNRTDEGYDTVRISQELLAKGYNILLYDPRARGDSKGTRYTLGDKEAKDVVAAVAFAKNRGFLPEKIGLVGNSTGAISLLMAIDRVNDVGAVVIDSAAARFGPIITSRLWVETHVPFFFEPGIFFFAKTFFGADFAAIKPIEKVKLVPSRKFLYLHTTNDHSVLPKESEELLASSNSGSKLVLFPDGGHIETYKKNPALYRDQVYKFLDEELGP